MEPNNKIGKRYQKYNMNGKVVAEFDTLEEFEAIKIPAFEPVEVTAESVHIAMLQEKNRQLEAELKAIREERDKWVQAFRILGGHTATPEEEMPKSN